MSIFDYYWRVTNGKDIPDYVTLRNREDYDNPKNSIVYVDSRHYLYINRNMPFKDFTFICTNGEVKAHRCVLWDRCEMFKTKSWNISNIAEMKVNFSTAVVNIIIDYIYGGSLNIHDPIDFDKYKFLDMINPSVNNAYMLVDADPNKFNEILDKYKEFEAAGVNPNRIIAIMASYILNTESIKNLSIDLPIEVVKDIMDSDYISEYESAVMIYINKYIRTNKFVGDEDIVKSLAGKVRWMYVRHKYMAGKLEKYMPELTIE